MNKDLHFSSKSEDWTTPKDIIETYGPFDLDACASFSNAICANFISKETDCLRVPWNRVGIKKVFMNPPYGRNIGKFIERAYNQAKEGCTVVCLLPARTDTSWFHDFCKKGTITFLRGRLKFSGHKNSAPFPSMIVVFSYERNKRLR